MIDYDSTVVERLREAGAVLVAKLSMGALAQGGRWFAGMTRNPWQPEEDHIGSSGSSAGPASATSAGLVGFSIGTETLGSIVSPSSRCGVTGLRPTYGRVSRYGAMGLSWTMDKIGPICRGVEDCALALDAIYGPDGRDITVGDAPFNWNPDRPLAQMRIGYLKTEFDGDRAAIRAAAKSERRCTRKLSTRCEQAGAKLEPIELPQFSAQSLRIILNAEAAAAFDDITRDGRVNQLSGQSAGDWPNTFRTSRFIPAVEYIRAQRARTLLMREMDSLMSKWDVFVSPAPGSASLLITNLTGHPAVVTPADSSTTCRRRSCSPAIYMTKPRRCAWPWLTSARRSGIRCIRIWRNWHSGTQPVSRYARRYGTSSSPPATLKRLTSRCACRVVSGRRYLVIDRRTRSTAESRSIRWPGET